MKNRPTDGDFAPYYKTYIENVDDGGFLSALQSNNIFELMENIPSEKWDYRYAEGKWSIKEMMIHIMDTERIFAYRALRIGRNDTTALAGFEQDGYVDYSRASMRTPESIINEYRTIRAATLSLFDSFGDEDYPRTGVASGAEVTVLALGYMIAGHEIHHRDILISRYLA